MGSFCGIWVHGGLSCFVCIEDYFLFVIRRSCSQISLTSISVLIFDISVVNFHDVFSSHSVICYQTSMNAGGIALFLTSWSATGLVSFYRVVEISVHIGTLVGFWHVSIPLIDSSGTIKLDFWYVLPIYFQVFGLECIQLDTLMGKHTSGLESAVSPVSWAK